MCNEDEIKNRLEDLKCYMYNEIQHLICEGSDRGELPRADSGYCREIQKYKPTKHKKAYKLERNFKKRCYVR
jgi:hypothetical protein